MEGLRLKWEDGGKKTAGNVVIDILRGSESGKSEIAEKFGVSVFNRVLRGCWSQNATFVQVEALKKSTSV